MLRVKDEVAAMTNGWGGAMDSIRSAFDPMERALRKAERKAAQQAVKDALPEIEAAQKEVVAARAAAAGERAKAAAAKSIAELRASANPAAEVVEVAAKNSKGLFERSARAGLRVVEAPIAIALKPVKWLSNGLASVVQKSPKASLAVGAAAVAVGTANWLGHRKAKYLQAQSDAIQQYQAMQQQASAPVSYMNSASYADVDARMAADRAAGVASSSQTAALAARQAAPEASQAI